jgi:hypothetical protein
MPSHPSGHEAIKRGISQAEAVKKGGKKESSMARKLGSCPPTDVDA